MPDLKVRQILAASANDLPFPMGSIFAPNAKATLICGHSQRIPSFYEV